MVNNSDYKNNGGKQGYNSGNNKPKQQQAAPRKPYEALQEETYVTRAEKVISNLNNTGVYVTTSQIRNILAMVNQIYNDVIMTTSETLSAEVQSQLRYLKIKIVYAAGRDPKNVKRFVEESQIADHLDHIGSSRQNFILYAHYMEALVAYHRFYGGKDA